MNLFSIRVLDQAREVELKIRWRRIRLGLDRV
jgi:hypothetical protein